jgi:hypothetical protein
MTVAIEDAGFEIRDSIHWIYGSGFPKSLDVSKAIDKRRDDSADESRRQVILTVTEWVRHARDAANLTNRDIDRVFGTNGMAGHWTSTKSQPSVPTADQWPQLLNLLGVDQPPPHVREAVDEWLRIKGQPAPTWSLRVVTGHHENPAPAQQWNANFGMPANPTPKERRDIPATDAARQWEGWGTALKPAHEPIVLARKPLDGTVAHNVLTHGTGALNINDCRIDSSDGYETAWDRPVSTNIGANSSSNYISDGTQHTIDISANKPTGGRWPANVIHDGHPDVVDRFPRAKGGAYPAVRGDAVSTTFASGQATEGGARQMGDDGSASRFFAATPYGDLDAASFVYVAKPSTAERNAGLDHLEARPAPKMDGGPFVSETGKDSTKVVARNFHPTVKPLALMRYLIRLVTPPGGIVLEPFAGSGTTLAAATLENMNSIGIELTDDYLPIIEARINWARQQHTNTSDNQPNLFDDINNGDPS